MKDIKNPKYLYIISLIIIILVSYLLLKENFVEKKCIQKALGTETEYLYPILKNISSSIELSYLCKNPYIITSMGSIKDSTRPYIFFHAEPGVTNSNDYNTDTLIIITKIIKTKIIKITITIIIIIIMIIIMITIIKK